MRNPSTSGIEISINEPLPASFEIDAAVALASASIKHKLAGLRACEELFNPETNTAGREPERMDRRF